MTLQENIDFQQYIRCFTFGKTDILPVVYDPGQRRYLVDHKYLSDELGARVVDDAQTINQALGYEMNTIEFAIKDGVPYAIDFLNPAPDFERDRITEFYFTHVVERMAQAGHRPRAARRYPSNTWPRWEEMLGIGAPAGFVGQPTAIAKAAPSASVAAGFAPAPAKPRTGPKNFMSGPARAPHLRNVFRLPKRGIELLRHDVELAPAFSNELNARMRAERLTFGDRVHCPFLRPFFLSLMTNSAFVQSPKPSPRSANAW